MGANSPVHCIRCRVNNADKTGFCPKCYQEVVQVARKGTCWVCEKDAYPAANRNTRICNDCLVTARGYSDRIGCSPREAIHMVWKQRAGDPRKAGKQLSPQDGFVELGTVMTTLGLLQGDHKYFREAGLIEVDKLGGNNGRTMMVETIKANHLFALINQRDKSLKKLPAEIYTRLQGLEEIPLLPLAS